MFSVFFIINLGMVFKNTSMLFIPLFIEKVEAGYNQDNLKFV